MTREEKHDIALARKEIEFFSILVHELCNQGFGYNTMKKELECRGCALDNEEHFNADNHWQVDVFATFCGFTLVEHEGRVGISYGWVFNGSNTDLYEWGIGDFRPYYNEETKQEWLEEYNKSDLDLYDTQIKAIIDNMRMGLEKKYIMSYYNLTEYQWRKLKEMERNYA